MCGIIGLLPKHDHDTSDAAPIILEGLRRLEYRGYDSAGIATINGGRIDRRRAEGKLMALADRLAQDPLAGTVGIGHTRWATHGPAVERNAHPHATDRVAVVHNGIIENYRELKAELEQVQCRFDTDTDTEVIPHLITHYLRQGDDPKTAAFRAFDRLQGAYAVAVIFSDDPRLMIGVRQGTPLAIGWGPTCTYLASDSYALAPFARDVTFLEDGDRVVATPEHVSITDSSGAPAIRAVHASLQSAALSGKGSYPHFMLKEIFEQPDVLAETLSALIHPATDSIRIDEDLLQALSAAPRLQMVACGTAYYACLVARSWFEQLARLPVDVDIASEFRYREPVLMPGTLACAVSQSGETLDTLEALRLCRRTGHSSLAIVNTLESTIERESDYVLRTRAGPEIGVASTKAFMTQLGVLFALALAVADKRGTLDETRRTELTAALRHIPKQLADTLTLNDRIRSIAADFVDVRDVLYLGRGRMYPLALEGALKLKEISYIHAEGYAAGEMKHGPIALIDDRVPIVALAPSDSVFDKTLSNLQEAAARGGPIYALCNQAGAATCASIARVHLVLPDTDPYLSPFLFTVPIQLLAYHTAALKGTDVDQPRNLAKSVTVE